MKDAADGLCAIDVKMKPRAADTRESTEWIWISVAAEQVLNKCVYRKPNQSKVGGSIGYIGEISVTFTPYDNLSMAIKLN